MTAACGASASALPRNYTGLAMAASRGILRRARGTSSAINFDTEEGRAFLQERLALFKDRFPAALAAKVDASLKK